jgi:RNA polymerase sigma-70 factor (ECF subfamily)
MWRHLPALRDPAKFEAWAYRILVNRCKREARRARRTVTDEVDPTSPRDAYAAVIDRDQLERAFRGLSVDQRTVLVLHHYVGMPVEVIAETLDIPLGTVKSRMARALGTLRSELGADLPGARSTHPAVTR